MSVSTRKSNKQIENSNKKFAKMPKKDKAIAIAKDVLKHLRHTNINNEKDYCAGEVKLPANTTCETNIQPYVSKLAKTCNVCALGGMFLSYIRLFDRVSYGDIGYMENYDHNISVGRSFITNKFEKIFTFDNLSDIESAFESKWIDNYPNPKDRMKAIMNNVITNDGRFVRDWM